MTNLKPFNWALALAGEKVVTKEGAKVSDIHLFDLKNKSYFSLVCAIDDELHFFDMLGCDEERNQCLFMAPKTKTYWLNIYGGSEIHPGERFFESEESAQTVGKGDRSYIKTISVEVEE